MQIKKYIQSTIEVSLLGKDLVESHPREKEVEY